MIGPVWDEFRDFWRNRFAGSRVHQNLYVWLQHHIIASTAQNLIEEREDRGPASDDGRGRDRAGPPRGSGGSGRGEARRPAAGEAQVGLVLHEAPAAEEAEVGPGGGAPTADLGVRRLRLGAGAERGKGIDLVEENRGSDSILRYRQKWA